MIICVMSFVDNLFVDQIEILITSYSFWTGSYIVTQQSVN